MAQLKGIHPRPKPPLLFDQLSLIKKKSHSESPNVLFIMHCLLRTVPRRPSQTAPYWAFGSHIALAKRENHAHASRNTHAGPLAGTKVLDLTRVLAV